MAFIYIRDTHTSGRLSIRNGERFGLAHLYFSEARLIHVTGDKRDGEIVLNDLLTWTKGTVRFDPSILVNYETVTWQQAELFTRWLSFLEMRAVVQGLPRTQVEGLAQSLTINLPGRPITLPQEVEHYEEYEGSTLARQWQRVSEGVQQFVERTLPEEQREQLRQVSQAAGQRMSEALQQAGDLTQTLARKAAKATQEGIRQAVETTQGVIEQNFNKERRQQIIQSTQQTVESLGQTVSQRVSQKMEAVSQTVETALSKPKSVLPPELQARSIRPMGSVPPPSPVSGGLSDG
jgi:hypothetical protein